MAASLSRAQYALRVCVKHDKKELQAFCKTCVEKICSSCIKGEHYSHDWELITDIIREKKRSLPVECQEIRTKQLPALRENIGRFDTKIEEEDTKLQQNKSVLNDSRQSYISTINQLYDDRIDECEQKSEDTKQLYRDKRDVLKQKVEYLETMTIALDKDINTLPDHDILDMEKEMNDELEKALSYIEDKYTCTMQFVPGKMNKHVLEEMIGDFKSFSINEEYDIDRYSEVIKSLKPVSDTKAFVMIGILCPVKAKLIERTGVELNTMKTPCFDLAVLNNGIFALADHKKGIIRVLTKDEDEIRTINTKPLYPSLISMTENDEILVSLIDDKTYSLKQTSRRVIQPHLHPFVISLHGSNLWCGFVEGRVKVFEYKN